MVRYLGQRSIFRDDEAVTPVLAFLVASIIFIGTFGVLMTQTFDQVTHPSEASSDAARAATAKNLLDMIVGTPGAGWYDSLAADCQDGVLEDEDLDVDAMEDPDVAQFALGTEFCLDPVDGSVFRNALDFNKVKNLEEGGIDANSSNAAVDYEEARATLGLDKLYVDFRLEGHPIIPEDLQEVLTTGFLDPNLKLAYVGAYDVDNGGGGSCSVADPDPVAVEVDFISGLLGTFRPNVTMSLCNNVADSIPYDATDADVYPQDSSHLETVLINQKLLPGGVPTLDNYSVVVIGSEVEHNNFQDADVKGGFGDWVREAGGYLVILGPGGTNQWTQSEFQVGMSSSNNVGDANETEAHAITSVPNVLNWEGYENGNYVFSFSGSADADEWEQVLTDDPWEEDANRRNMYLALAPYGTSSTGKGQLLLTGFQPYLLTETDEENCGATPNEDCEGMKFLQNIVTLAYHGLFLSYGPPVPDDEPNAAASRIVVIDHPALNRRLALSVQIFVFNGA